MEIICWCAVVEKEPAENNIWKGYSLVKGRGLKYINFLKGIQLDFICTKMKLMKNKKIFAANILRTVLVLQTTTNFYAEGQQELCPFYM